MRSCTRRTLVAIAAAGTAVSFLTPSKATAQVAPRIATAPERAAQDAPAPRRVPLGPEIARGDSEWPFVALTFDAGAGATNTPRILEALRERAVRTTWFATGQWVERYPSLFEQILDDGHEVANHTFWHPDLTRLTRNEVLAEIEAAEQAVLLAGGESTRPLFRFPYGARNAGLLTLIEEMGFRSVMWTFDSGDWRPELAPAAVQARVLRDSNPGSIVVMHADSPQTAQVLGSIIDGLSARGLQVATVTETVIGPEPAE